MANITRSTLPSQLLEGIKENFGVKYKEVPLIAETVFDVETSGKFTVAANTAGVINTIPHRNDISIFFI